MRKYALICAFFGVFLTGCGTEVENQLASLEVPLTTGVTAKLEPSFKPNVTDYTLNVPNDISIVEVLPVAADEGATITVNGIDPKAEKEPIDPTREGAVALPLAEGENQALISVQNADSSEPSEYNLTIVREDLSGVREKFLDLSYTSPTTGITLPYRLYVPASYTAGTETEYPIVFFLHGSGERGDDNEAQLTGNLGATVWATEEVQKKQEMFVLAPQARAGDDSTGFGMTRVGDQIDLRNVYTLSDDAITAKEILDQVISDYPIDDNRIYGTGLSQGGFGIWNLDLAYPDLFAAIVPVAAGGDPDNPNVEKISDQPIWAFHAAADPIIPVETERAMVEKLQSLGSDIKYTEYPTTDYFYPMAHASWIPAYHDEEMIDWLLAQSKSQEQ